MNYREIVMNILEFKLDEAMYGTDKVPSKVLAIYIDGKSLTDMVDDYARKHPEKNVSNSAKYAVWRYINYVFTEMAWEFRAEEFNHEIGLLGCTCGYDCDNLMVQILENEECVTWHSFSSGCSSDDEHAYKQFDEFGPFVFDRKQYYGQLTKLAVWCYENDEWIDNVPYFYVYKLFCGGLQVSYGMGKNMFLYRFNEEHYDPIPNMVRMYNAIKSGVDFSFKIDRDWEDYAHWIVFKVENYDKDTLEFSISSNSMSREKTDLNEYYNDSLLESLPVTELKSRMNRLDLLDKFDYFFNTLRLHRDYEYQFPFHCDINEKELDLADERESSIVAEIESQGVELTDKQYFSIVKKCQREQAGILPEWEGRNKYRKMLKDHIVPIGW